jgi:ATP-dependent DNA ligase
VFDLLRLGDKDLRPRPLYRRKSLLQKLLGKNDTLRYVDHIVGEGLAMFGGVRALGMEGIIAKDPTSHYVEEPTQTWHWQKIKSKDYERKKKVEFKQNR